MACSRSEGTLELTAQKGFIPLISWVPPPTQLKQMIEIYQRAGAKAHRHAPLSRVRVARMVYVTDSVHQAKRDLYDVDLGAAKVTGRLNHYIPAGGTRDDLTMEFMIDQGAFFLRRSRYRLSGDQEPLPRDWRLWRLTSTRRQRLGHSRTAGALDAALYVRRCADVWTNLDPDRAAT